MRPRTHQLLMDFLLLMVAFFWGTTFIIVKSAISQAAVFDFLFFRFALAFLIMAALFRKRLLPLHFPTMISGLILGAFLFAAFAFQTWGLLTVTATDTAFITGLNVVMVPILSLILLRKPPAPLAAAGVLLAAAGLYFLTGGAPGKWTAGEFLVFLCAVSVALHILLTGFYAARLDTPSLATWQLGAVALMSMGCSIWRGGPYLFQPLAVWVAVVVTAVFATVFAFAVQTYAQRFTTPTRTALILTGEPVFGALFAHWYGGEALLLEHLIGGGLIFLGMVLSQIRPGIWGRINPLGNRLNGAAAERPLPSAPPSPEA